MAARPRTDGTVLVTGGTGFLGQHVVKQLSHDGYRTVALGRTARLDQTVPDFHAIDFVIHCAAVVGGIGANRLRPATFFADNMRMGLNILDACARAQTPLLMVGTTCSYPGELSPPFNEDALWSGAPERTNAAYGIAKRALIQAARAYHEQFGLRVATAILANLYGPGDHDDLMTSHVIPGIIRRVRRAQAHGAKSIELWGDGTPTRDFLHVRDAAGAVVALGYRLQQGALRYDLYNVGTGEEHSIREVAQMILSLAGESGIEISWDPTEPNGQQRRALDVARLQDEVAWRPRISLVEGLRACLEATK